MRMSVLTHHIQMFSEIPENLCLGFWAPLKAQCPGMMYLLYPCLMESGKIRKYKIPVNFQGPFLWLLGPLFTLGPKDPCTLLS